MNAARSGLNGRAGLGRAEMTATGSWPSSRRYGASRSTSGATVETSTIRQESLTAGNLILAGDAPPKRGAIWDDGPVEHRVSLVTLGVSHVARARAFYEALGWVTRAEPDDDVVFFQAGGMVVALWSRDKLAEDSGVEDGGGWGGVTLAHNVRSPTDVDAVLEEALRGGARIARAGAETFWGGYSGVFVDPDGHPWEVAHNPRWTLADDGSVVLPDRA